MKYWLIQQILNLYIFYETFVPCGETLWKWGSGCCRSIDVFPLRFIVIFFLILAIFFAIFFAPLTRNIFYSGPDSDLIAPPSTRNSGCDARCAQVAPSLEFLWMTSLSLYLSRPLEGSSWCRRSPPSWPRHPRWLAWILDWAPPSALTLTQCFCLIFANMLSSSPSLASSGAVVKWDELDDMGNYFLMLGMPVGPLICSDFA